MKNKFGIDLTIQNKLIIVALLISTALMVLVSFWAISKVKSEAEKADYTVYNLMELCDIL